MFEKQKTTTTTDNASETYPKMGGIVSFPILSYKVDVQMVRVPEDQDIALIVSYQEIINIMTRVFFQWLMLEKIPVVHNFLFATAEPIQHTLTENILALVK